jgi:hypothetical protein
VSSSSRIRERSNPCPSSSLGTRSVLSSGHLRPGLTLTIPFCLDDSQYVSVEAISTGYNTTGFNTVTALGGVDAQVGAARASAKPVNHRVATKLFSTVQHISKAEAGSAGGVVNFDFVFPDQDERGTRMPPSMQLESTRFAGGSVGYCESMEFCS